MGRPNQTLTIVSGVWEHRVMDEQSFRSRVVDVGGGFIGHNAAVSELIAAVGHEEVIAAATATLIGRQSLLVCTPTRLLVANSIPKLFGNRFVGMQELTFPLLEVAAIGRDFTATAADQRVELRIDEEIAARNLALAVRSGGMDALDPDPVARLASQIRQLGCPLHPMHLHSLAKMVGPLVGELPVAAVRCEDSANRGIDLLLVVSPSRLLAHGQLGMGGPKRTHSLTVDRNDLVGVSRTGVDSLELLTTTGSVHLTSCRPTVTPLLELR